MTHTPKALIISTSADRLDDGTETGLWLSELTDPYYQLVDAGIEVDIASVKGGAVPVDARSLEEEDASGSYRRYEEDSKLKSSLGNTPAFDAVDTSHYDAIFFPGGHGAMIDYPRHEGLLSLVDLWLESGKTLAAVCHGPAVLVKAIARNGVPAIAGRKVAGFSNSEEAQTGLEASVPFSLESQLRAAGGEYVSGADFSPFAVQDGNLITGQNPQSAAHVGRLLVNRLLSKSRRNDQFVLEGADSDALV